MYILFRFSAEKLRKIGKKYNRSACGGEKGMMLSHTGWKTYDWICMSQPYKFVRL